MQDRSKEGKVLKGQEVSCSDVVDRLKINDEKNLCKVVGAKDWIVLWSIRFEREINSFRSYH